MKKGGPLAEDFRKIVPTAQTLFIHGAPGPIVQPIVGEARFRAGFLRHVLHALQLESGGRAFDQLATRLPPVLLPLLRSPSLQAGGTEQFLPLDQAEEFLLGVESALGDGSGAVLERLGQALATQAAFSQSGELARGDVYDCMLRVSHEMVGAFVACPVRFDLVRTDTGFNLSFGVSGYPRATRVLRHLTLGAVRAAFTFALEATSNRLKVYSHIVGDRAEITARYRAQEDHGDITPPPSSRERPRHSTRPSVALEVERILSHAPRQGSTPPRRAPAEFDHTPVPDAPRTTSLIPKAPRLPQLGNVELPHRDTTPTDTADETLRPGAPETEIWKRVR